MNDKLHLAAFLWEKSDAVSIFRGSLYSWTGEQARDLYMHALIPSWEAR